MKPVAFVFLIAIVLPARAQQPAFRRDLGKEMQNRTYGLAFGPSFLFHPNLSAPLEVSFPYQVNHDMLAQFSARKEAVFPAPLVLWNVHFRSGWRNQVVALDCGLSKNNVTFGISYGYRITPRPLLGGRLFLIPLVSGQFASAQRQLGTIDNRDRTITAFGKTYDSTFVYRNRYGHKTVDSDHINVSYQHNFAYLAPGMLFQFHPFRNSLALDVVIQYNIVVRDRSKIYLEQRSDKRYQAGGTHTTALTDPAITATIGGAMTTQVPYSFSGWNLTLRLAAVGGPSPSKTKKH